jgi:hypothetical protein
MNPEYTPPPAGRIWTSDAGLRTNVQEASDFATYVNKLLEVYGDVPFKKLRRGGEFDCTFINDSGYPLEFTGEVDARGNIRKVIIRKARPESIEETG